MKNLSLILALVLTLCFLTACAPDNSAELEAKIASLETQLQELENTVNEQAKTIEEEEEEEETTTQVLNLSNYQEYIAVNITYDELQLLDRVNTLPDPSDRYVCRMTITTSARRPNISFENAYIKYNIQEVESSLHSWYPTGTGDQKAMIGADGSSSISIYLYTYPAHSHLDTELFQIVTFPSSDSNVPVIAATGTVIINE